jgi:hypothetical protein
MSKKTGWNQKTFIAYGHRYRIVYVTFTYGNAKSGKRTYEDNPKVKGVALHQLTDGRWAIGVR